MSEGVENLSRVDAPTVSAAGSSAAVGGDPPPPEADLPPGTRLGDHVITGLLGRGGMGCVYLSEHPVLGRRHAIKVLPATFREDSEEFQRFMREARAAAGLQHPNTVGLHEIGRQSGRHFIVMEYVSGGSVWDRLARRGPLAWPEAVRIMADVCRAVVAAHDQGLIHRDIKPANILLTPQGVAKLADFGLVKPNVDADSLTPTGSIVGTPEYMSPEQCRGDAIDMRTDLYALGCTLYAMLTGESPFARAGNTAKIMQAHCFVAVPDPRTIRGDVPEPLVHILHRSMAKAPEARFQTAAEMLADLEAVGRGQPLSPATTQPPSPSRGPRHPAMPAVEAAPEPRPSTAALIGAAALGFASFLLLAALLAWMLW